MMKRKSLKREEEKERNLNQVLYPQGQKGKSRIRYIVGKTEENKRLYVTELENKIDLMQQEIIKLNNTIDKLKFKIGVHVIGEEKDFQEFAEQQEFQRQTAVKSLQEGKDKEELKRNISEFAKTSGLKSNDRKKLIKAAIRVIIDNLVPQRIRVLMNLCEKRRDDATYEEVAKLFKADPQRYEVDSKDPKFDEIHK